MSLIHIGEYSGDILGLQVKDFFLGVLYKIVEKSGKRLLCKLRYLCKICGCDFIYY